MKAWFPALETSAALIEEEMATVLGAVMHMACLDGVEAVLGGSIASTAAIQSSMTD